MVTDLTVGLLHLKNTLNEF